MPPLNCMEQLNDLYPLENYAHFKGGGLKRLRWNNNALLYASEYYRLEVGEATDPDRLLASVTTLSTIKALLFGALRAADPSISPMRFGQIYAPEHLGEYLQVALDGIIHYLPPPESEDTGENLDESYPDTQSEVKKNKSHSKPIGGIGTGSHGQSAGSRLLSLARRLSAR